jgi:hypothetical protein
MRITLRLGWNRVQRPTKARGTEKVPSRADGDAQVSCARPSAKHVELAASDGLPLRAAQTMDYFLELMVKLKLTLLPWILPLKEPSASR